MPPNTPIQDRTLASNDLALHPGWALLEFLLSVGADEFAVTLIHLGDDGKDVCDQLVQKLAFASLGERTRECTVRYDKQNNLRPINVWRLDLQALEALRDVMPSGILPSDGMSLAWAEDLCIYRRGEMLLGTVTHEQFAFLRVSTDEWKQWEAIAGHRVE